MATMCVALLRMAVAFRVNTRMLRTSRWEAITDALTGLGNRRRLMDDLEASMDSVERHGRELGIRAYERYPKLKSHFHSTPIQIAAESGLLALAAWIWLMAACFSAPLALPSLISNTIGKFGRGLLVAEVE